MRTRIMLSAGEASGDLHAGALANALRKLEPTLEIYGMGGAALASAGGEVLFDIKDYSVMGFAEVIANLPKLYRLKESFRKVLRERRPDCLVVIDYPDFNMRIASIAHKMGIPVISFISPSAWVWRKGRAKKVARIVDKVAAIFPMEYDVYKAAGADTEFVGHPLLDIVEPTLERSEALTLAGKRKGHPLVLLLPGSRLQEIERMLPIFLAAAKHLRKKHQEIDFVMPRASTIPASLLTEHMERAGVSVQIAEGHIYDIMSVADAAIATSGTVTLEAALLALPTVICYKAAGWAVRLVKHLVHIKYFGLPNIVVGRQILPELLQEDMTAERICKEVEYFLSTEGSSAVRRDLELVSKALGEKGAVERVARMCLEVGMRNEE